ncbi:MAG: AEC family transporter [Pararhodobacter sp.]
MFDILMTTLPIYLMIVIGYVSVRSGYLSGAHVPGLGQYVLKIALIGLIFNAIAVQRDTTTLNPSFFVAYLVGSLVTMILSFFAAKFLLRRPAAESWILAMGMANANGGFLGYPITALFFGDRGAVVFAMAFTIENVVTLPFAIVAAGIAGHTGDTRTLIRDAALKIVKNPFIIAVALSMLVRMLDIPLGAPVERVFGMIAASAAPVALFVIGGTVAGMSASGHWRRTTLVAAGKLGLHPLLVAAALILVPGVPPELIPVGIVYAAMPMLTIYPILAAPFGLQAVTSTALLVSTALSLFTVSFVISLV